ncbi:hypothetical protein Bca52824_038278 [Brassica carinata]|uniref:Fucosyltransferase n=1 Tax=Brassica carinata TaxID=52824 RepID=A0A8X7RTU2_BRACI|nr:hypothetical protein Bca52824_038278 [Brassica carinata]
MDQLFLSQFIGSSRWCMITSIARFLAAFFELVTEACLGNKLSKQARSLREIKVYQPSRERYQQIDEKIHDQKALTEMYLLSLADNVVTSARSTSGYVATCS